MQLLYVRKLIKNLQLRSDSKPNFSIQTDRIYANVFRINLTKKYEAITYKMRCGCAKRTQ